MHAESPDPERIEESVTLALVRRMSVTPANCHRALFCSHDLDRVGVDISLGILG
jgi:hypothetical protein